MIITQVLLDSATTKENELPRFHEDMKRIVAIAGTMGLTITTHQAQDIWEEWSASMSAGWMVLSDDVQVCRAQVTDAVDLFITSRLGKSA